MQFLEAYSKQYDVLIPFYNQTMRISGLAYPPDFYKYSSYYQKHIVENHEEFRPDKIAYNIWGNQLLSWVLNQINYFTHGIQEYTAGREINYLDAEMLRDLGIL